jgi:hypothetical protein
MSWVADGSSITAGGSAHTAREVDGCASRAQLQRRSAKALNLRGSQRKLTSTGRAQSASACRAEAAALPVEIRDAGKLEAASGRYAELVVMLAALVRRNGGDGAEEEPAAKTAEDEVQGPPVAFAAARAAQISPIALFLARSPFSIKER